MTATTEITWRYNPASFFNEHFILLLNCGEFSAQNGNAMLKLKSDIDPTLPETFISIKDEVLAVFEIRQIIAHCSFELFSPQTIQYDSGGARSVSVNIMGIGCFALSGQSDIVITNADGIIVIDTKAERLASEAEFINDLSPKMMCSSTLRAIARSYGQAVRDPQNELVHLYEVRDAVAKYYGSESSARSALKISKKEWQTLGRLANEEPLRQGRHRGKKIVGLRPAAQSELTEARAITKNIIKAFAAAV